MLDILFRDITVVPMSSMSSMSSMPSISGSHGFFKGSVGVSGKKIAYVGESKPLEAKRVIDGRGKVLIPGLYNCHSHSPMVLLRGYAGDKPLQEWLFDYIIPAEQAMPPEGAYRGAILAIAEMVASGTIAFSDMYFNVEDIARAVDETGVKANITNAMTGFGIDFKKDRSYTQTLAVHKNFASLSHGRIKAEAGIHGEYTSDPHAWHQCLDFAHEHGLRMHLHLSETKREHEECKARHNMTPAQVFEKHGVFGVPTTAAHCVWAEEQDLDIFLDKKVNVVHNPISNLKLASGFAPVSRMLSKGVNVALGTDGASSNNSLDLFEEIKIGSILQKNATGDPRAIPALQALRLATSNGALCQGRENESGRIEEGLDADLAVLDFNNERQTGSLDPLSNIAYSCTGRDVWLTMCQGKVLYEGGEFKTIDIEKAVREAEALVASPLWKRKLG
ncbi:MAG: amidohydrolase [Clostridiales bacterium]|nr:amidohydrolase [Clostridiales bacterium]